MMAEYQRERRRGRTGKQRKGHERGCNDLSGHRDSQDFLVFCRKEEGRTTGRRSSQHHKKQEMTIRSMAAVQTKTRQGQAEANKLAH